MVKSAPWHWVGVCRFAHHGMPPLLREMEDLRQVVCQATANLISGVEVPQGREVAEFGVPLAAGSLPVPPKRTNERVMEKMVGVPVPQMKQENVEEPFVEVVRLVPQARVQRAASTSCTGSQEYWRD